MAVQEDSTTTSESTVTGRRIALVIGVNDAPGYGKAPLKYASDDAKDIAKVLQKFCGFELLEPPLLNEQATTERIKKAVRRLARGRSDEDFLLLYFSGHGHPMMFESLDRRDIYLVSQDFDVTELDQDEEAHLSMRWLRDKFYIPTQAGRVLLILDCCYAGDMGRTAPDPFLEELKQRINYYFGAPGKESGARSGGLRWALTATGHNATTKEENGHGLMTGPLLLALQGKISEARNETGQVSIHRVYEYLHEALPFDQKPSLSGDAAGRLCILASYPERAIRLRANRSPSIAHRHPNSYLPFYRDDLFQERPGEFERLETLLFNRANKQYSVRQPLVAVTGMWGVGKSGLAKELAYRYKDRFPDGIFWMSATGNEVSWEEQFAELALHTRYLPPDDDPSSNSDYKRQRALYFCEYLADHKDALLILDNVEDPERVTSFLPELFGKEPSCTILYTSQIQFVPHTVKHHDVERLPEPLALSLLLATTRPDLFKQIEEGCSSAECQAASTVCHVVGYLPLALIHLRGLLKHDDQISLARLAEVLRQRSADIIKACFEAFRLSWNRVSNEHAKSLFKLACFFPEASPIPLWLLGLAAGLGERSDIVDPLGKAYRDLRNVSLLEKLSNDLVRLHPLVRQFGQRLVEEDGDAGKALRIEAGQRLVK